MRRHLAGLLVGLVVGSGSVVRAQAPDCTPQPLEWLQWGEAGQAIVPLSSDPANFVPVGQVWKIRAAGIATDDGGSLEWMLQIDHKVVTQGDVCCWLIPLMRLTGTSAGTPVLALNREVVLTAGERLSARVNGLGATKKMAILFVGWRFPAACTSALVLGVNGSAVSPPPDFTALIAATTTLQTATAALLAAIPR